MKIRIISDLHMEFGAVSLPSCDSDVVILAGDIHKKLNALPWIREIFPAEQPVVYICGNHEFYGAKYPRVIEKLKEATASDENIHVLENESIEIGGFSFWGATLWSDMALNGDVIRGCAAANQAMNDYRAIRFVDGAYRRLRAEDTRMAHLMSLNRLQDFLEANDPQRSVIVTHMAPSRMSVPERFQYDLVSCAFASNLDWLIEAFQPKLWIHGHTHDTDSKN
ncbi:MAG: metallophosphoesterase [Opitutales bacterium]